MCILCNNEIYNEVINVCIISLKSMTYAHKAERAIKEMNINAEIVKLEPHMTSKGCAYGIRFNCSDLAEIQSIMKRKSIRYSELINM